MRRMRRWFIRARNDYTWRVLCSFIDMESSVQVKKAKHGKYHRVWQVSSNELEAIQFSKETLHLDFEIWSALGDDAICRWYPRRSEVMASISRKVAQIRERVYGEVQ